MTRMPVPCRQIEPDLVALAEGDADAVRGERVRAHTAVCPPCQVSLERYRVIEGAVSALRDEPATVPGAVAAREQLEARLLDLRSRLLTYRVFPSPFGELLIARSEQGVALVEYLAGSPRLTASRLSRVAGVEVVEGGDEVEAVYRNLVDYLGGRTSRLGWPLDLRLVRTEFHRSVLRATAAIPYGAVLSYTALAREVGRPEAVRAVAQALRWNPLPIVIPCHRVIGASGVLTGYAGGETSRKQRLLSVEGVPTVPLSRDHRVCRDRMYLLMPGDTEYCLPTCPSAESVRLRQPMLFGSRDRAEAAGLQPCTTCRPDLHPLAEAN